MPVCPECIKITNKILKDFFNNHSPLITKDNVCWSLNNQYSNAETIDEKGNKYTLWPFPIDSPLFFSFTISIKPNDQIDKVNIKIFKEDVSKQKVDTFLPTNLLLRVEWDNAPQKEDANFKHAQPHWHIHDYKVVNLLEGLDSGDRKTILDLLNTNEMETLSSIMDEIEQVAVPVNIERSESSIKEIPSYRFHLAMLAEWDKSSFVKHNKILTNEIIKLWLPNCLKYIKGQLEYTLGKMS